MVISELDSNGRYAPRHEPLMAIHRLIHCLVAVTFCDAVAQDPLRVRTPAVAPPLLPLQWGTVSPGGWLRDWAVAASEGAVSPTNSWFSTGSGVQRTPAQQKALMDNGTDWPAGVGRANGWRRGQPAWTMDEQSAYWM